MRLAFAAALLLVSILPASAATISSLDPAIIPVNSGEYNMFIHGHGLGQYVVFEGPAGVIRLKAQSADENRTTVWIPIEVVSTAGVYAVRVTNAGDHDTLSNPARFEVVGDAQAPRDTTPPVLTLPNRITVDAEDENGTNVTFQASAHDNVDGNLTVDCNPKSGSRFPIGVTSVQCVAIDSSGNFTQGSFEIEVVFDDDHGTLAIHVPNDITVAATSSNGAVVTYIVTASGSDDPNPVISCGPASGSTFAIGDTTVTCTAHDAYGDLVIGQFVVRVTDAAGPHIASVTASPDVLSPANHKLVDVTITVDASDTVDAAPPQCMIVNVTANEAVDAPGSGNTDFDWNVTGPLTVQLRAERSGEGNDRIYTVHVTCADANGNESYAAATVTVPKGSSNSGNSGGSSPKKRRAGGKG